MNSTSWGVDFGDHETMIFTRTKITGFQRINDLGFFHALLGQKLQGFKELMIWGLSCLAWEP